MTVDISTYARKGLEAELARLDHERERVRALLVSLDGAGSKAAAREPASGKRVRQMSEAGRQAIREAVRRRWERVRAAAAEASGAVVATENAASLKVKTANSRARATRGNRKK